VLISVFFWGYAFMMVSGYAVFEFERLNLIEGIVIALMGGFFWYLYYSISTEKNT
jgi:hypothetical protein